jgi:hypothetical protein
MRKITIALLLLFASATWASAEGMAIQPRLYGGGFFLPAEEWKDLYGDRFQGRIGFSFDAELVSGFGMYLSLAGGVKEHDPLDGITAQYGTAELGLGFGYRGFATYYFAPGVRAGAVLFRSVETIRDDYVDYQMDYNGLGADAALDFNFYPWGNRDHGVRGLGFVLSVHYQYRPVDHLGKLDDASAIGITGGIQYRWDFRKPKPAPAEVPAPAPQPAPPPQPAPESPPPEPSPSPEPPR